MTRHPPLDIPEFIRDSAMVLAVVFHELGFDDSIMETLDRGKKLLDDAMTKNTDDALGDDLDGYSVAVGFAAAMGAFASCVAEADGATGISCKVDAQEIIKQMRKARNN